VGEAPRGISTKIDCSCAVNIFVYPPDRRRRDLDNFLKSLLDALVYSKVLEDDSLIDDLRIVRKDIVVGGEVLVMIEKLEAK
jgi:crossover junction endodeoxyribonuclease RusA